MLQLGPLGEGHIVAVRDPDEEIEGALRRDALVAHLGQLPVEQAAVGIIGRQVRPGIGAPLESQLHQRRRADMAGAAGGPGYSVEHVGLTLYAGGDADVTDAFTGQGQGFGVGVAHQRIGIDGGQEGDLHAVVDLVACAGLSLGDLALHEAADGDTAAIFAWRAGAVRLHDV